MREIHQKQRLHESKFDTLQSTFPSSHFDSKTNISVFNIHLDFLHNSNLTFVKWLLILKLWVTISSFPGLTFQHILAFELIHNVATIIASYPRHANAHLQTVSATSKWRNSGHQQVMYLYSMYDTQTNTILKTPYPTGQFYIRSALSPKQARTLQVFFALLQKVRKPIALFIELPKTEIELILI